jgi:hypothetical protein
MPGGFHGALRAFLAYVWGIITDEGFPELTVLSAIPKILKGVVEEIAKTELSSVGFVAA